MQHFNQIFRQDYAWQRKEMLSATGPWIWVIGDALVLFHDGEREEAVGIPRRYHVMKAFAHVPLAVYVVLATDTEQGLSTEAIRRASELRNEIASLQKELRDNGESYGFSDRERTRQRRFLEESDGFLERVLRNGAVSEEELHLFTRRQRQPVMANAAEAARAQIETTHAQVRRWRQMLGQKRWDALTVVISGPAMPRARNLAVQYFAKALKEKGEGRRILYAENLFNEPAVTDRLGTDLLDSLIGDAFFDDDRRMHRDLLSDAASDVLRELPLDR